MLEIKDLKKYYCGHRGLAGVDLALPAGQIVGLFGENGAGKTTLLKCILNLLEYKGQIRLDGQDITHKNIHRISFATCEHSFFPTLDATAHREFYEMQFPAFDRRRFEALMTFFELPQKKPLKAFSTGQKNQFEVILALCQGADYILMDEPFAGNDLFNREDFYKVLLGILQPHETVVLSTHLIDEVKDFVSRAVLLREGVIVGDITTEQLQDEGRDLVEYIKATYHYRPDRVGKALQQLNGEDEG